MVEGENPIPTGRAGSRIAVLVFFLVGALLAFGLPSLFAPAEEPFVVQVLQILGGVFLALGGLGLLWMLIDYYVGYYSPEHHGAVYLGGEVLLGLLAAGLFAMPATLAFPVMYVAYQNRPNLFFPADSPQTTQNLWLGLLFSCVGLLTFGGMFLAARALAQPRPQPSELETDLDSQTVSDEEESPAE